MPTSLVLTNRAWLTLPPFLVREVMYGLAQIVRMNLYNAISVVLDLTSANLFFKKKTTFNRNFTN